jgi:alpha-mannosidase
MQDRVEAILISETHWDRAWYRTFQQFRLRLVNLVNELLDILDEDPEFKTFTFDGQTVVIEDYLEMVPHQRKRLVRLARCVPCIWRGSDSQSPDGAQDW